jgi:hypothetical protein
MIKIVVRIGSEGRFVFSSRYYNRSSEVYPTLSERPYLNLREHLETLTGIFFQNVSKPKFGATQLVHSYEQLTSHQSTLIWSTLFEVLYLKYFICNNLKENELGNRLKYEAKQI